jgi:hypothetical protein
MAMLRVGTLLDQIFAKPPMPVEGGAVQIGISSKGSKHFAVLEQVSDSAHVAVISTPLIRDTPPSSLADGLPPAWM